ncbi:MAG: hypothetical protein MJ200_02860 [Mycoplasmoidaceae bacterium]|nr:hypothetical protein [Mycoplasmoidaceae bacterium]
MQSDGAAIITRFSTISSEIAYANAEIILFAFSACDNKFSSCNQIFFACLT